MRTLSQLFDAEPFRRSAEELINTLSSEEKVQWLVHPCTKALLNTLQGDYIEIHSAWQSGEFTTEKSDGTAQSNAKALGQLDAIRLISSYIEEINYDASSDGI